MEKGSYCEKTILAGKGVKRGSSMSTVDFRAPDDGPETPLSKGLSSTILGFAEARSGSEAINSLGVSEREARCADGVSFLASGTGGPVAVAPGLRECCGRADGAPDVVLGLAYLSRAGIPFVMFSAIRDKETADKTRTKNNQ